MNTNALVAALVALCFAGCASRTVGPDRADFRPARLPESRGECIFSQTIDHWNRIDDYTLVVWTSGNKGYRVKLEQRCLALRDPNVTLGFLSRDNLICDYQDDEIFVPSTTGQRCTIGSIEPYQKPGEEKAAGG